MGVGPRIKEQTTKMIVPIENFLEYAHLNAAAMIFLYLIWRVKQPHCEVTWRKLHRKADFTEELEYDHALVIC